MLKISKILIFILIVSGIFASGYLKAAEPEQKLLVKEQKPLKVSRPLYVSDEIIVKFKNDSKFFRTVKIPPGQVKEKVKEYKSKKGVIYAEPNYYIYTTMIPNDPLYQYQWHMDNPVSGGIQMEQAWDITTGTSSVIVAVIDTGVAYEDYSDPVPAGCYGKSGGLKTCRPKVEIYYQAPDLASTTFLILAGSDIVNGDDHPNDDEGHGTHVAGTVAQSTNNELGVSGVAFNTTIMPVKVLDANGSGLSSGVADGIYFATDNGAKIINLSLGSSDPSTVIENAVAYAYNNGVTVIAASGNEGASAIIYPAGYDSYVIAVGATRYDETLAYYSNYGFSLDIVAPGGDVNVDQNGDGYVDGILQQTFGTDTSDFSYWFYQGTSMAAPHVSGVAALLLAKDSGLTPDEVRTALESSAKDLGIAGRDDTYGWGLVDAEAALLSISAVSISLTTDGATPFGIMPLGTTLDTTLSGTGDVQTISIDAGPADLNIKTTVFSDGGNSWSLGTVSGDNQAVWEYSKEGSAWDIFQVADSIYPLASGLTVGQTQDIYFRLTTPISTVSSAEYSSTVTIVATMP